MEQDAYQIFTRAHQVYIKGIRAGIAECLKSAYGSDWWEFGVLSALGDDQRENLERDRQKGCAGRSRSTAGHCPFLFVSWRETTRPRLPTSSPTLIPA